MSLKFLPNNMNLVPCVRPSQLLAHTERMSGLALDYCMRSPVTSVGGEREKGREEKGRVEGRWEGGKEEEEGRKLRKGGRR